MQIIHTYIHADHTYIHTYTHTYIHTYRRENWSKQLHYQLFLEFNWLQKSSSVVCVQYEVCMYVCVCICIHVCKIPPLRVSCSVCIHTYVYSYIHECASAICEVSHQVTYTHITYIRSLHIVPKITYERAHVFCECMYIMEQSRN
jgi:hypothetical protein